MGEKITLKNRACPTYIAKSAQQLLLSFNKALKQARETLSPLILQITLGACMHAGVQNGGTRGLDIVCTGVYALLCATYSFTMNSGHFNSSHALTFLASSALLLQDVVSTPDVFFVNSDNRCAEQALYFFFSIYDLKFFGM